MISNVKTVPRSSFPQISPNQIFFDFVDFIFKIKERLQTIIYMQM